MKNFIALLTTTIFSMSLVSFYIVKSVKNYDQIGQYLGSGDVESLSTYFSEEIAIEFPENTDAYDIEDCKYKLTDFFFNHPPIKFLIKHQGKSSNGEDSYMIGKLITETGNFRIVVEMKKELIYCVMIQTEYRNKKLIGAITQN